MNKTHIEIVPAVLRRTWEGIQEDWARLDGVSEHIQLDVTDGVFAGDGTFSDIKQFKQLPSSEKIELHMMVHTPSNFVESIIDLNPARCVFHLESFEGTHDMRFVYAKLREETSSELGLAINPASPAERLEEHLEMLDYVLFMGYSPGFAGQEIDESVFRKIAQFAERHSNVPIAVDGGVGKDSIPDYVKAGARILCANSAILKEGDPRENYRQLQLIAEAAIQK